MKQLILDLDKLAKQLGFGKGVVSYDKLYKTKINTFGHKQASMWYFTIGLNVNDLIVDVQINTTYFKHTPQTIIINNNTSFDKPISFETAFKLIESLNNENV